jgi:hypothetical protein
MARLGNERKLTGYCVFMLSPTETTRLDKNRDPIPFIVYGTLPAFLV